MPALQFHPVMALSFEKFTAAFNHAYSDYFTPIVMSVPGFQGLIARESLDLDASVAVLDEHAIVGTGLLGIRGSRGWIGGMGVIPSRRRQGIGRQMMQYLIDQARQRGLAKLQLEVIEANTGAQALYREMGFQDTRYLHVLTREPQDISSTDNTYRVVQQEAEDLLTHYAAFHDTRNCWQRSDLSLQGLVSHAAGFAALDGEHVAGYALGWFDPDGIRLADLATRVTDTTTRHAIAHAVLAHVHTVYPRAHGNAINIADDDPLLQAYLDVGYHTDFRQIEMELML
ncbi:MAG: GNAT family N-acetyltransferase [Anaerolineae bacterium]|nr:GNAT family N-acetyltransferase [Anaerolineae bacterium]